MADRRRYPVADSTSPVMWLVWLFAILAASACSTVQVEPKLDTRKDIPALNVQRLPIRAALVLPDLPQTVSSPPFSCPLMANSYVMTVQPSPLLTLAGVPLLAQAFDSLDVITDKAAAAGQYDLFIELGTPRIQFMEGDCGTVLHILGYLFPLTTPTALVATFLAVPGIDAEMEFRATVMEARGERLLADIAFKARKAVLEPGMGPGLPGTNLEAIVADLFTKLTRRSSARRESSNMPVRSNASPRNAKDRRRLRFPQRR